MNLESKLRFSFSFLQKSINSHGYMTGGFTNYKPQLCCQQLNKIKRLIIFFLYLCTWDILYLLISSCLYSWSKVTRKSFNKTPILLVNNTIQKFVGDQMYWFTDQMLVYRAETSPNYLFTQEKVFLMNNESNFTVVGNWLTKENWGAAQAVNHASSACKCNTPFRLLSVVY